ncbi:hypothetical protein [Biostraticola tofi]|nr:hypothetical protein [Biostraticola tofi]
MPVSAWGHSMPVSAEMQTMGETEEYEEVLWPLSYEKDEPPLWPEDRPYADSSESASTHNDNEQVKDLNNQSSVIVTEEVTDVHYVNESSELRGDCQGPADYAEKEQGCLCAGNPSAADRSPDWADNPLEPLALNNDAAVVALILNDLTLPPSGKDERHQESAMAEFETGWTWQEPWPWAWNG